MRGKPDAATLIYSGFPPANNVKRIIPPAGIIGVALMLVPAMGAADAAVYVSNTMGSSVPGCEETDDCFVPGAVTIDAGGVVSWGNDDVAAHTVTSGSSSSGPDGLFDSGLFMPGTAFSFRFEEAGEYPYYCMVHPWMEGTVMVVDDVPPGGASGAVATPALSGDAQEWRYLDVNVEVAEQRWQYHDEGTDLLVLELAVTNNENRFLYGNDVYLDAVVVDGLDKRTYPKTYWTDGRMAEHCPEHVKSATAGRTEIWNACFEVPSGEAPDFLRIYDRPVSQIVQFNSYSAPCRDTYGDLCSPRTLDGGLSAEGYLAACPDVDNFNLNNGKSLAECWSDGFAALLDHVLYLEELVDALAYEREMSPPAAHRTTIEETEIRWEFYDSKDNYYQWTLPVSAYEDAVAQSRIRSAFMGVDPLRLDMDGEAVSTTNLDGFVIGSFGNVIGDVYANSRDDADFVWEVWYIVSQLTVYDEDVHAHSEGRYATETFSRGGGDCEDLVILVADMLVSSEHTADWTIQYVYMDGDSPNDPQEINHMILFVDDGTSTYLIEATAEPSWDYYPDGVRGWFIDVRDGSV